MFPKQKCPVCQNRAFEGTFTANLAKSQNEELNKRVLKLLAQMDNMQITIDNFKEERKDYLAEIRDLHDNYEQLEMEYAALEQNL